MVDQWSFWRLTSGSSPHVESDFTTDTENVFCFPPQLFIQEQILIQLLHPLGRCLTILRRTQMGCFPGRRHSLEISDEAFMEKTRSWLDNLKLRVSYGITGNSGGTDAYSTTTQAYVYSASGGLRQWKNRSFHTILGDLQQCRPRLGKIVQLGHRSGLQLLNSRIDGSIEWFRTATKKDIQAYIFHHPAD